ncbi:MAG: glycerate 2-kinase [Verrucomicrobiota bacterium]
MRVLIAPDKFKGVLSAREVAETVAAGLRYVLPNAKIDIVPLADGGEGTAEIISEALRGTWRSCSAHDPLGREITPQYAWVENRKLAVMEMSEAAGMRRVQNERVDVDLATTFGVGEMILDASRQGAREIIIGLGGSATNDGGFGMARALGFKFFTDDRLKRSIAELAKLTRIEKPKQLALPKIVAAADVRNPLLGENGATRVFGPQKGVTPDKIDMFERALTRLADVVTAEFHFDFRETPSAGAAGGLGFGLASFCGATLQSGFDVVADAIGLEAKMHDVDLVITGEGSLDRQTLSGKTPVGVAQMARSLGKRVCAIAGRSSEDRQVHERFDGVHVVMREGVTEQEAMTNARELLRERARELARTLEKRGR